MDEDRRAVYGLCTERVIWRRRHAGQEDGGWNHKAQNETDEPRQCETVDCCRQVIEKENSEAKRKRSGELTALYRIVRATGIDAIYPARTCSTHTSFVGGSLIYVMCFYGVSCVTPVIPIRKRATAQTPVTSGPKPRRPAGQNYRPS